MGKRVLLKSYYKVIHILETKHQTKKLYRSNITTPNTFSDTQNCMTNEFYNMQNIFNSGQYMMAQTSQKYYNFLKLTLDRKQEIKNISGTKQLLYDSLNSAAISIWYLGVLAILISLYHRNTSSAKSTLKNNDQVYLLVKNDIFIFKNRRTYNNKKYCRTYMIQDTSSPRKINSLFHGTQWDWKFTIDSTKFQNKEAINNDRNLNRQLDSHLTNTDSNETALSLLKGQSLHTKEWIKNSTITKLSELFLPSISEIVTKNSITRFQTEQAESKLNQPKNTFVTIKITYETSITITNGISRSNHINTDFTGAFHCLSLEKSSQKLTSFTLPFKNA